MLINYGEEVSSSARGSLADGHERDPPNWTPREGCSVTQSALIVRKHTPTLWTFYTILGLWSSKRPRSWTSSTLRNVPDWGWLKRHHSWMQYTIQNWGRWHMVTGVFHGDRCIAAFVIRRIPSSDGYVGEYICRNVTPLTGNAHEVLPGWWDFRLAIYFQMVQKEKKVIYTLQIFCELLGAANFFF